MKKFLLALFMALCFSCGAFAEWDGDAIDIATLPKYKYEYKIVPLGSLTSLQKGKDTTGKTAEIEKLLNQYGKDRWEIAEIFAVRTTFDPNVFFVIMKRQLDE